jgi:hypothetical protein
MKNILLIAVIALSGCSLIPSKYDGILYDRVVELSVDVDLAGDKCGTPSIKDAILAINRESKILTRYTVYASKDVAPSINLVDKAISQMYNTYQTGTPSVGYCKLKLTIIRNDLNAIQQAIEDKNQ